MRQCLVRPAFSLTEVLIVISLIVLILALAMPAFNFITGSRSEDAALNQISAMLARARTEAVGIQKPVGIMFYIDPKSDRQMMAIVKQADAKIGDASNVDVYLDAEDADHVALPRGIGVQVFNADNAAGAADTYLGFNPYVLRGSGNTIRVGGIILFDGFGRLLSDRYGFRMSIAGKASTMANLIAPQSDGGGTVPNDFTPVIGNPPLTTFGFVVFDDGTAREQFGNDYVLDPTFTTGVNETATKEESWLSQNATPVTINRYNGTLLKSQ